MWIEVSDYCKSCKRCKLNKSARVNPSMGSLRAQKPLDIIAIDFTTIKKSDKGIENILVITDVFTLFWQAIPTKNQTAKCEATVLTSSWFDRFGFPRQIHSDQGRNFESEVIRFLDFSLLIVQIIIAFNLFCVMIFLNHVFNLLNALKHLSLFHELAGDTISNFNRV